MLEDRIELKGYLFNSVSNYLVVVDDEGKAIEIDDTLLRSKFLQMQVKITIEYLK